MKIFNYNFSFSKKKEKNILDVSVPKVEFALPALPIIKELRGRDYIYYGEDNLYPQHLKRIVMQSPTQSAIIKSKAGMMAGDGFLLNGAKTKDESKLIYDALPADVKLKFDTLMKNPNNELTLEEIKSKLCLDYETYGAYALEVVWSMDFSKIVTFKYVNVANVRSGKITNDKVSEYWISRDWFYFTKEGFEPYSIAAFDPNNKEQYNQLIYVKAGTLEYYGEPAYAETISYVEMEGKIANFHLSNITNGFSPSMALKFYSKPGSPEKEKVIVDGIKKQYAGTGNAGRPLIFFSDGKENAPDISDIPVSNLDKQFTATNDLTVQNILTGNQVTSPLLFGISTPGSLGGSKELDTAYKIFNSSVMASDRKQIDKTFNKIFEINKIPMIVETAPFNPLA